MSNSEAFTKHGKYLGDGVYAGFDGLHVVLRLGSHLNSDGEIFLEDNTALSLIDYIQDKFRFIKSSNGEAEGSG